jgi:hypothetical protein
MREFWINIDDLLVWDWHRVKVPETVLPIVHLPIILKESSVYEAGEFHIVFFLERSFCVTGLVGCWKEVERVFPFVCFFVCAFGLRIFFCSEVLRDWFGWLLKRSERSDSFFFFLFTRLVWEFDFKKYFKKNCWQDFLLLLTDQLLYISYPSN